MAQYYVYILCSERNGTLYVGITNNLLRRVKEHKDKIADGFTRKYNVNRLVYFEIHEDVYEAIRREKQLKKWNRRWKLELIEKGNPEWVDLFHDLADHAGFPLSREGQNQTGMVE